MGWIVFKYLVTAGMVVLVSEFAKRSDKLGALVAALPLVTMLTLVWLHLEKQPAAKVANHAWYTFWYVIPTLPMFLVFPPLLARIGFWPALAACALLTAACFGGFALFLKRYGILLM
jgi:hypothetical protein